MVTARSEVYSTRRRGFSSAYSTRVEILDMRVFDSVLWNIDVEDMEGGSRGVLERSIGLYYA